MRHRSLLLLIVAMLGFAVLPFPRESASAACAAPFLDVGARRLVLERGTTASVVGRAFVDGCRDTMSCSVGCNSCEYEDPPPVPMKNVTLRLVQGGRAWKLDVADAVTEENNRFGRVTWTFVVPVGVRPGRATLDPDGAEPLRIRIR